MTRLTRDDAQLRDLIGRIAQADGTAFKDFYTATEGAVFAFVRRRLNDPFEAADVLHQVFLEVWRRADSYTGRSAVATWLFGIAHNKTVDRYRKRRADVPLDETAYAEVADEAPAADELIAKAAEAGAVRACLGKLSPDHRQAVELLFYEELGYAEIAEIVGRPEGTIKTRVFHAKQALKRCLARALRRE